MEVLLPFGSAEWFQAWYVLLGVLERRLSFSRSGTSNTREDGTQVYGGTLDFVYQLRDDVVLGLDDLVQRVDFLLRFRRFK